MAAASPRERHGEPGPAGARDVLPDYPAKRHSSASSAQRRDVCRVDRLIAAIASEQQDLISIRQLMDLGLGRAAVWERVRSGRLFPKHRGVFAVGTPNLPPLGRERAALLAVPGSVLSHASAAAICGLMAPHPSGPVHLTATTQRRSRPGIVVHRTNHLPADDVRIVRGVPVTSAVRVVLDLAPGLGTAALERLIAEALAREPRAGGELARRGTARTRALVAGGPRRTRSGVERRLLALVRDAGLPVPQTNATVHGEEVDAFWPAQRLVVEVDTYATHGDRIAFARDRRKQAALVARGLTVSRVTDRDLEDAPARVVAQLAQALGAAAA